MKNVIRGVFLAAGEGKRMRPLTYTRPKVMLPLANKPILEHLLCETIRAGITEYVFIVGYHDNEVRDYFGNGDRWGVRISYVTQARQQGTADAVSMVEGSIDSSFILLNGDIVVFSHDLKRIMESGYNTVGVVEVADTMGLGVMEMSEGNLVRIHEKTDKPPSQIVNAGIYLFTRDIFGSIHETPKSSRGEYEIPDSLQLMVDRGIPIRCCQIDSWINVSYPWDLLSANEYLMKNTESQNMGEAENNVVMKAPVYVDKGTILRAGSYIVGPVTIGKNCSIGPNCYIRPYTAIGDGCHVGGSVEIKNSIVMKGSRIPHHNYIGDSIIGEHCNLGAGTKIANLRLDKMDIIISGINTKRRKMGAVLGDNVETGINACIDVGSLLGNSSMVGPGATVSGIISPYTRIF